MIIMNVDSKSWALKHDIEIKNEICRKCGKEVVVNIPVISPDYVGFESEPHECGLGYRISILKQRIKK